MAPHKGQLILTGFIYSPLLPLLERPDCHGESPGFRKHPLGELRQRFNGIHFCRVDVQNHLFRILVVYPDVGIICLNDAQTTDVDDFKIGYMLRKTHPPVFDVPL